MPADHTAGFFWRLPGKRTLPEIIPNGIGGVRAGAGNAIPLYRRRRLARNIVNHPRDACDFIDDAARAQVEQLVRQVRPARGHEINHLRIDRALRKEINSGLLSVTGRPVPRRSLQGRGRLRDHTVCTRLERGDQSGLARPRELSTQRTACLITPPDQYCQLLARDLMKDLMK